MRKIFSLKNNRLAKTIVFSGTALIIIAFIIMRYEGFFGILSTVMNILRPVIIGCVIAFALNRPLNFFHEKYRKLFARIHNFFRKKKKGFVKKRLASGKAPFALACVTTYLVTLASLTAIICFLIPQISASIELFRENFSAYLDNFIDFIESNRFHWISFLDDKVDVNLIIEKVQKKLETLPKYIPTVLSEAYNITSGILGSIINGTIDIVVGIVFSVYILIDKRNLKKKASIISKIMFKEEKYTKIERIVKIAYDTFSNFITGQIMEAIILGILCFVGMTIFGFQYAPLISVIIGITNMIPIVGPIIGTIPGALILLLVDPISAVWFVVFIIIIQQIDSNLIYPRVVGNSIGLPALWVLFAITVGGGLCGVLGMLLGVPIVSIIYTLLNEKIADYQKNKAIEK